MRKVKQASPDAKAVEENRQVLVQVPMLEAFRKEMQGIVDVETRRARLFQMAETVIGPVWQTQLSDRRREFNSFKARQLGGSRWRHCYCCGFEADEIHHILELQYGGLCKDLVNLVPLCSGCHASIHPWMKKTDGQIRPAKGFEDCFYRERIIDAFAAFGKSDRSSEDVDELRIAVSVILNTYTKAYAEVRHAA